MKFILAAILLTLTGCFIIVRGEEVLGSTSSFSPQLNLYLSELLKFESEEEQTVTFTRSSWNIGFAKNRPILRVDQDGDIFLRGKWIGWDGRLKDQMEKIWYGNK